MKKTLYILIVLWYIASFPLCAQQIKLKSTELSINAFYGFSGLTGTLSNGTLSPGTNPQFMVEGSYFFNRYFGAGIGIGYAGYTGTTKLNSYQSSTAVTDEDGDQLKYKVNATGVSEKEKLSALEVPLFLVFRHPCSTVYLEAKAGIKVSIPVSSSYRYTGGTITTTGEYETYGVEIADLADHGFQTIINPDFSGKLSSSTALSLFTSAGVVIPIKQFKMRLNLYGAYGLSSIFTLENMGLASYPAAYHPAISLCDKVSLLSGGIQVGIVL